MKKEMLTSRQTICLVSMFLFGSAAIIGSGTEVEQDSWIALLMAAAFSAPFFLLLGRLGRLFPDKGFFDLVEMLLGKIAGKIVIALMAWYCLHLCALVLRDFSEFVGVCVMPETPHMPIMLIMMLTVVYLVKSGVETMGKWSIFMLPVILMVLVMTVLFSLNIMDLSRIQPVAAHDIGDIAKSAYMNVAFPYLETVVFLCAFQGAIESRRPYKPYILAFLLGTAALVTIDLRNTLLLGTKVLDAVYFPSYIASKVIQLGNIISRIEGSIAMNFVIGGVAKISICLLGAARGVEHLFGLRGYKQFVLPLGLLAAALCGTLYERNIELYEFLKIYQIYAIPFQIFIPLLIWILAEIRAKKDRAQKTADSQA